jgi:hypothetical protein
VVAVLRVEIVGELVDITCETVVTEDGRTCPWGVRSTMPAIDRVIAMMIEHIESHKKVATMIEKAR